ncbi:hypothetical protein BGZ63DRAFT_420466 [Mariannaea sp. PMI_226]|nr:hypothetical protein BGZ63DRAFT_420466 [Mariannaea sp. PMI_226]
MGFFDDSASILSGRSSHRRSKSHKKRRSRSRSRSRSSSRDRRRSGRSIAGSIFGGNEKHHHHSSSRSSFFGLGGNHSRSSFFGNNRSSYYKRSPRQGFVSKSIKHVKRLWRDLVHWAKRHPWKVFFTVVLPLLTGGFLTALLARFGLRIPAGLQRMLNTASKAASSGSPIGMAGEAVKMVSGGLNKGASSSVHVKREQSTFGFGGGSGSDLGGAGLVSMAKKFM